MAKQPKIRFKGFTEEWKEKTVEEVSIRLDNLRIPIAASLRVAGDTPYYGANGIQDYVEGYTHDGENILIAEDGASDTDVYPVRITRGKIWVNNHAHVLRGINGVMSNPFLLYALLKTDFSKILVGGTRHKLTTKALNSTIISFTQDEKEQKAITQTLSLFDTTISQRETELEKLKNIKRALLEKLFPQDGQSIPAIRFKGFEGKWENRRLKDIATRITRKNIGLESTLPLCISAQLGLVSQTEYYNNVVVGANLANYFLIKKGEFAYNKSAAGEYPMGAVKCLKSPDKGILSTLYIVFALKDDIDADYVQAHYETKPWQDDVKKRVAVGARNHGLLNISPEDFFDSLVVIPHNNDEQKKVGQILAKLSQTISLRERQLTLLKHTKQALLEQMFVNE